MSQAIGRTSIAYARVWHEIDLKEQVLGRISPRIATLLMGKHKPIYDPAGTIALIFRAIAFFKADYFINHNKYLSRQRTVEIM